MNIVGLVATIVKRQKKRDSFEHWAWFHKCDYPVEKHGEHYKDEIRKFLKRYKKSDLLEAVSKKHAWKFEEDESNPFFILDDNAMDEKGEQFKIS